VGVGDLREGGQRAAGPAGAELGPHAQRLAGAALEEAVAVAVDQGRGQRRAGRSDGRARLAAGFADLAVTPSLGEAVLVAGGLLALAAAATAFVARRVVGEPVVAGLREE
jgi:hypothetical protein